MSSPAPLLSGTIEADDDTASNFPRGNIGQTISASSTRAPVVLVPGTSGSGVSGADDGSIVSHNVDGELLAEFSFH